MLRIVFVLAALLALTAPAAAAPLEAYGRLPDIETAALSPDGTTVAVMGTVGAQRVLSIRKVGAATNLLMIGAGRMKLRSLQWVGADHLLITASVTTDITDVYAPRSEWTNVIDINLKARTQMNVMAGAQNAIRAAIGAPTARLLGGKPFVFVQAYHFVGDLGRDSLYRINLASGEIDLIAEGRPETDDWLVGANGAPIAESRYDAATSKRSLRVWRKDGWSAVVDTGVSSFGDDSLLGLGRDGQSVMSNTLKDGHDALRELAPGAQAWSEPFAVMDSEDSIFDPVDGRLIGVHTLAGDVDRYAFFAPADETAWETVAKSFPGSRISLAGLSSDHKKWLLAVDSPVSGAAFDVVDAETGAVVPIGRAYSALAPVDIATVQPVAFKAADGLALTGYLTLPKGRDAKALPLVVFPHGGPAVRDEPGFDWWAQAMASRGYAVLQVNYRGSDGFGGDFLKAGFGQWGRKMQTDLSDGVRYLAGQGIVDPKRVCIVGASYGGYAALAGPTLDPGVYRCAVDVAGISDLRRFVDWARHQSSVSAQRYWDSFMGAKDPADPHLAEISPVAHVDAVDAPILIVHGKDDTVVPFEQSQIMVDALKKAGKPVDFVVLNHEDHWLSSSDTRLQMLQATIDFLEKHNPPG